MPYKIIIGYLTKKKYFCYNSFKYCPFQLEVIFLEINFSVSYLCSFLFFRISKKGKTIVFSIHQPRYTIYSLFDRLFLLSKGRTVYHGPSNETLDYFRGQGISLKSCEKKFIIVWSLTVLDEYIGNHYWKCIIFSNIT